MYYVGIDNGKDGGIVAINENNEIILKEVMPLIISNKSRNVYDIKKIIKILNDLKENSSIMVFTERMQPVFGKGGLKASFGLGYSYGLMEGILSSLNISYVIIPAKKWQKELFAGINTKDTKLASLQYCQKMFPKEDWRKNDRCKKKHTGLTDACCLSEYGKIKYTN